MSKQIVAALALLAAGGAADTHHNTTQSAPAALTVPAALKPVPFLLLEDDLGDLAPLEEADALDKSEMVPRGFIRAREDAEGADDEDEDDARTDDAARRMSLCDLMLRPPKPAGVESFEHPQPAHRYTSRGQHPKTGLPTYGPGKPGIQPLQGAYEVPRRPKGFISPRGLNARPANTARHPGHSISPGFTAAEQKAINAYLLVSRQEAQASLAQPTTTARKLPTRYVDGCIWWKPVARLVPPVCSAEFWAGYGPVSMCETRADRGMGRGADRREPVEPEVDPKEDEMSQEAEAGATDDNQKTKKAEAERYRRQRLESGTSLVKIEVDDDFVDRLVVAGKLDPEDARSPKVLALLLGEVLQNALGQ